MPPVPGIQKRTEIIMDQKTLKRNRIMFPLGTVGRDMMYQMFTSTFTPSCCSPRN